MGELSSHEAFSRALMDSSYTAGQTDALISIVEAAEEFLSGSPQAGPVAFQCLLPWHLAQEPNPTIPALYLLKCIASALRETLRAPSGNSSFSKPSQAQSANERMAGLYSGVQQQSESFAAWVNEQNPIGKNYLQSNGIDLSGFPDLTSEGQDK